MVAFVDVAYLFEPVRKLADGNQTIHDLFQAALI